MHKLPRTAGQLALALFLLLASAAAVPQQANSRYTVEILVFRTTSQVGALPGNPPADPVIDDDVETTPATPRKLNGAATRLRNAGGFRILAQAAWSQTPTAFNSGRGVSAARLNLTRAGITGKVFLERGQNLNLRIDLTIEDGGRSYHLSEVRKVKTDETQYFDHPAAGVVAVVTAGG